MDEKHLKYINLLSKIALTIEPVRKVRMAACLVHRNEILSFGICQMKSHPFQAQYSKNSDSIFLHAETDCIKNALKTSSLHNISKSTLYICRMKYSSSDKSKMIFGLSKPCLGCQSAISTFDIRSIVYTMDGDGVEIIE